MTELRPITFDNAAGEQLVGILHLPDGDATRRPCVLLLSPGVKMRVAPHRMYNKMADRYVHQGFAVLRFDFAGLGDAEGEIEFDRLSHVYNSIQLGRFVADTRSAMDYLQSQYGFSRFVAGGLCGGAITGLLTAQNDKRIIGLLALGIPVALDVGESNWSDNLTKGQLDQLRDGYVRKLLDPKSWLRLLTFKSDFKVIWKSLQRLFERTRPAPPAAATEPAPNDNTNPKFAPAFFAMAESGRPQLHVFSGSDRLAFEFQEKFAERHAQRLAACRAQYEVHTIDKANHILAHPAWFADMLDITGRWLKRFQ